MSDHPHRGAETLRNLRAVRSVRSFRPDPVGDDLIDPILEVARWTGSGMNQQPWTFVVVREPATLHAIAAASPNTGHVGRAPAAIVIVTEGTSEIVTYDEARAAERILVAATALGLASAIGWVMPPARPAVQALLGVPAGHAVRTLVSLGFPTEESAKHKSAPGTARKPLSEVVRQERFS
ncbi:MAG: nitroreductase family protein [Chloroflexota bacterium]